MIWEEGRLKGEGEGGRWREMMEERQVEEDGEEVGVEEEEEVAGDGVGDEVLQAGTAGDMVLAILDIQVCSLGYVTHFLPQSQA